MSLGHHRVLLGGLVYLCAAEYFAAEQVAAAAWSAPAYSWTSNYISDLGLTSCSQSVCSPDHAVMNAGFAALGIVVSLGSWLLRDQLFSGRLGRAALSLMLLSGVGDVLVGLFPGSVETQASGSNLLHVVGAVLSIGGGNAGILVCGIALARARRTRLVAGYSVCSGVVGLVALGLFAQEIDLGLGIGGIERVAAYPIVIWMVLLGADILIRRRSVPPRG